MRRPSRRWPLGDALYVAAVAARVVVSGTALAAPDRMERAVEVLAPASDPRESPDDPGERAHVREIGRRVLSGAACGPLHVSAAASVPRVAVLVTERCWPGRGSKWA